MERSGQGCGDAASFTVSSSNRTQHLRTSRVKTSIVLHMLCLRAARAVMTGWLPPDSIFAALQSRDTVALAVANADFLDTLITLWQYASEAEAAVPDGTGVDTQMFLCIKGFAASNPCMQVSQLPAEAVVAAQLPQDGYSLLHRVGPVQQVLWQQAGRLAPTC